MFAPLAATSRLPIAPTEDEPSDKTLVLKEERFRKE
jgi:hypothetical protein